MGFGRSAFCLIAPDQNPQKKRGPRLTHARGPEKPTPKDKSKSPRRLARAFR